MNKKAVCFSLLITCFLLTQGRVETGAAESAGTTLLVSVAYDGSPANGRSFNPSISANGHFVAYASEASNLVAEDTNNYQDIFVYDIKKGVTELVSVSSDGRQGNNFSYEPSISEDGRLVAFTSLADNLVEGITHRDFDVYVHDRETGITQRASIPRDPSWSAGAFRPQITADGRFVSFSSYSSSLVENDQNHLIDVFVYDRLSGVTELAGIPPVVGEFSYYYELFGSGENQITPDGRHVVFTKWVPIGCQYGPCIYLPYGVYVRDRQLGTTEKLVIPHPSGGNYGNLGDATISTDGRYVALLAGEGNSLDTSIFVYDRMDGTAELLNVPETGYAEDKNGTPLITSDGRYVILSSAASNLVPGDTNGKFDVFLIDRMTHNTALISLSKDGSQGNCDSREPSVSANGRVIAFSSCASNLVGGDTNNTADIFVTSRHGNDVVRSWWHFLPLVVR